jgi:hypothetical protein
MKKLKCILILLQVFVFEYGFAQKTSPIKEALASIKDSNAKSVLANSEIEYKQFDDESLYFTFNTDNGLKLIVWTTTEWTVFGVGLVLFMDGW